MWEASLSALRSVVGPVAVVTDGNAGFTPRMNDVEVLPYLHLELRRGSALPPSQVERLVSYPTRNRFAVQRAQQIRSGRRALGPIARRWREVIGSAEGLVISGAGAMTDDFGPHGVASWWLATRWAADQGVPVILLGQGIGPLVDPVLRGLAAEIISYATVVNVREEDSASTVTALVPGARPIVAPDWALLNGPDDQDRTRALDYAQEVSGGREFVALSAHRRHTTHRSQLRQLASLLGEVTERCLQEDRSVLFVPNMTGTRYSDDRATFDLVSSSWPAGLRSKVHVVRDPIGPRVTRALLGHAEFLVTTRYHPLVFAMAEATPAVGISYDDYYEQKLSGASAMFGVSQNVRSVDAANADWVLHTATATGRPQTLATDANVDLLRHALSPTGVAVTERT
jgi:polysaccharide pyruvyl transferase WcaK-like protein